MQRVASKTLTASLLLLLLCPVSAQSIGNGPKTEIDQLYVHSPYNDIATTTPSCDTGTRYYFDDYVSSGCQGGLESLEISPTRAYASTNAVFTQPDPDFSPTKPGLLYGYGGKDPVNARDPSGLRTVNPETEDMNYTPYVPPPSKEQGLLDYIQGIDSQNLADCAIVSTIVCFTVPGAQAACYVAIVCGGAATVVELAQGKKTPAQAATEVAVGAVIGAGIKGVAGRMVAAETAAASKEASQPLGARVASLLADQSGEVRVGGTGQVDDTVDPFTTVKELHDFLTRFYSGLAECAKSDNCVVASARVREMLIERFGMNPSHGNYVTLMDPAGEMALPTFQWVAASQGITYKFGAEASLEASAWHTAYALFESPGGPVSLVIDTYGTNNPAKWVKPLDQWLRRWGLVHQMREQLALHTSGQGRQ